MLRFGSRINNKTIFFSEKVDGVNELIYDTVKTWFINLS